MFLWQMSVVPLLRHSRHPTVAHVYLLKNVNCHVVDFDDQAELLYLLHCISLLLSLFGVMKVKKEILKNHLVYSDDGCFRWLQNAALLYTV